MLFHFPGDPLPMPRHRTLLMRAGEARPARGCPACKQRLRCKGCGCWIATYEHADPRYEKAKRALRALVLPSQEVIVAPLAVTLRFAMVPPTSWSQWRTEAALAGLEHPIGAQTGDADNLAKVPMDALQEVLWANDAQIKRLVVEKVYAAEAGTDLLVETLPRVLTAQEWKDRDPRQPSLFAAA